MIPEEAFDRLQPLHTKRLIIRPLVMNDVEAIFAFKSDLKRPS